LASEDSNKLINTVGAYTENLKDKDKTPSAVRELNKFVKHFQGDTNLNAITPAQIGDYAEQAGRNSLSEEVVEGLQSVRKFLAFAFKEEKTTVNLSTHFRVRKTKTASNSGSRRSAKKDEQEITQEGHDQLTKEKTQLESNRVNISNAIQTAAEDGDVRENAPLEAAREQQGREEARIKEIDAMLRSSIIVDTSGRGTKVIRVGTTFTVEDIDKKKKTKYTLVSPSEANPSEGKVSDASPLGRAILGKKAGQKATANTPRGKTNYKITSIS
tara:strand:+ start:1243 stop:2055 length:813 start_codon:yes stop_codon:yes gene_type:complete